MAENAKPLNDSKVSREEASLRGGPRHMWDGEEASRCHGIGAARLRRRGGRSGGGRKTPPTNLYLAHGQRLRRTSLKGKIKEDCILLGFLTLIQEAILTPSRNM